MPRMVRNGSRHCLIMGHSNLAGAPVVGGTSRWRIFPSQRSSKELLKDAVLTGKKALGRPHEGRGALGVGAALPLFTAEPPVDHLRIHRAEIRRVAHVRPVVLERRVLRIRIESGGQNGRI